MLTYVRIGNLYKPYKLPIRMAIRIANPYVRQLFLIPAFFLYGLQIFFNKKTKNNKNFAMIKQINSKYILMINFNSVFA